MATLWLVGMMGAGKTTVGRVLAGRLGRPFVDLDEALEETAGRTIAEVFAAEGEAGFRRREAAVVAAVAGEAAVVACGGGVVTDPGSVALMRRTGMVAWLEAPVEVLAARVGDGAGRPLLAGEGPARLGPLLASREGAYAAAAHCRVVSAGRTPDGVADEVMRAWSEYR